MKLSANEIGEFVRFKSCERRFKLEFNGRKEAKKLLFSTRLFNTLDPILQKAGKERELQWQESLDASGYTCFFDGESFPKNNEHTPNSKIFFDQLKELTPGKKVYAREVPLSGKIGIFDIEGRADFILVYWVDDKPHIKIVECKSSRKDKTYHKIQVAIYKLLFEYNLNHKKLKVNGNTITNSQLSCVVGRLNEDTNDPQPILELPNLDLKMEESDVRRITQKSGMLEKILQKDLDEIDYQLDTKCDSCVFNVHCFAESGRRRSLHLLGLEPAVIRILLSKQIRTIDDLADLNLKSKQAKQLSTNTELNAHLENLIIRAKARRSKLPGPDRNDEFPVLTLKNVGEGQLPQYQQGEDALMRIYLNVDYDYVENRIGAISAHITNSEFQVITRFEEDNDPVPGIEEGPIKTNSEGKERIDLEKLRPLVGSDIVELVDTPWTGDYKESNGREKQVIQRFFTKLIQEIDKLTDKTHARIHFYVWSKREMSHLVEACSRAGSDLLGSLKELLGCREPTEQLIYSSLQDEINNKFALGWTGRGLTVATSLPWFGHRYHWTRKVNGKAIKKLDHEFTQDLFDFKTTLHIDNNGNWADPNEGNQQVFEIRSRYFDSLSAPYWRAYWGVLRADPNSKDIRLRNSIERYNKAKKPGLLQTYLEARCHALRWIEERIKNKNPDILKPKLEIEEIREYRLDVNSAVDAGIDFLQLDHHINLSDWIAAQLVPPKYRILNGKTLPIKNLKDRGNNIVEAEINVDGYGVDIEALKLNCEVSEGHFSRVTICNEDPSKGQTIKQFFKFACTCILNTVDWENKTVEFQIIPDKGDDRYRLISYTAEFIVEHVAYATIDSSPSDYVAGTVEQQLEESREKFINDWFHPERSNIPKSAELDTSKQTLYRNFLSDFKQPNGYPLGDDQINSIVDGLSSTIQLLQGPPGTGKTTTTSNSILLRIADAIKPGEIILLSSLTHTAINGLLEKVRKLLPSFQEEAKKNGVTMPKVTIGRVNAKSEDTTEIIKISEKSPTNRICKHMKDSCLILGGTTSKLIKMVRELNKSEKFPERNAGRQFSTPLLVIDEASMLVFPYFLSLASLVSEDGKIMLSGDHRQLAPIVSNDWDNEDRPPSVLYKPFVSSYVGVDAIKTKHKKPNSSLRRSFLDHSYRLPPKVRELISKIYTIDNITLKGSKHLEAGNTNNLKSFEDLCKAPTGLYLIIHDENKSHEKNLIEAKIIKKIIENADLEESSTAVITPHRAQKKLLKDVLSKYLSPGPIDMIDTVERIQGGEKPNIFVSGTVSDPTTIGKRAEFILNMNRANVAFSRTQNRLFVICAKSLLDHIPPESDDYESAILWKSIRELCNTSLFSGTADNIGYNVYTVNENSIEPQHESKEKPN